MLKFYKFFLSAIICICCIQCTFSPKGRTESAKTDNEGKNYVVGYVFVRGSNTDNIRWHALTHLNIAFLYANEDGTLSDSQIGNSIAEIVEKAHKNNVKVLVSLRDDDQGELIKALTNNRSTLVNNLLKFVKDYHLDGIDFDFEDWEKEGVIPHLHAFAREFHEKKGADVLFTCAVNTWDRGYSKEWHTWFDFINIMTYDVHGPWNNEGQHSPYEESLAAVEFWKTNLNAPANKLTLGLPFYGYSWNEGDRPGQSYSYERILAKYPEMDVSNQDQIESVYYNGKKTIMKKTQWAKDNKIAGVMIWQLGGDAKTDDDSLLEAIGKIMKN